MRRLLSHIFLAAASALTVATVFPVLVEQTSTNMEYTTGKEFTYRIDKADDSSALDIDYNGVAGSSIKEIADIMEERLITADVSRYTIKTEGNNIVKVSFYQDNNEDYGTIAKYLSFNGSIALTTKYVESDKENFKYITSDNFVKSGSKAYIGSKYYSSIAANVPVFVLPVEKTDEFDMLIGTANTDLYAEEETTKDGEGNDSTVKKNYIYLWYNFNEEADHSFWNTEDSTAQDNYFLTKFQVGGEGVDTENEEYFLDGKDDNKLFAFNENAMNSESPSLKSKGYRQLNLMANLVNACKLDYKVTMMSSNDIEIPLIESFMSYSEFSAPAMNKTLIATICATVIISLLLVAFFKLGAVSVISTTLLSALFSFLFISLLSAEYTSLTLFGLIAVVLASLFSGIVVLSKLKNELYKGKTLKKANLEATKKSVLPIIDINVIPVILGVFGYIFGGTAVRSFAVVTVLGGLVSLLLNLIFLRAMTWLVTNSSACTKLSLYGVDVKNIPDTMKEEKQQYFGDYADKDLTKHGKKFSLANLLVAVGALVGAVIFGSTTSLYNQTTPVVNSSIYFDTTIEDSGDLTEDKLTDFLSNFYVYEEGETPEQTEDKCLSNFIESFEFYTECGSTSYVISYSTPQGEKEQTEIEHFYAIVNLKSDLNENIYAFVKNDLPDVGNNFDVNTILTNAIDSSSFTDKELVVSLKASAIVSSGEIELGGIILGFGVGLAVLTLYYAVRFGLSAGLSMGIVSLSYGIVSIGFFALVRLSITNYVIGATPIILLIALAMGVIISDKNKELMYEQKEDSFETKNETFNKAISYSFGTNVIAVIIAAYLAINFFGFGNDTLALPFAFTAVMTLLLLLVLPKVFGTLRPMLLKAFKNFKLPEKQGRKKEMAVTKKSAEPEEAIFPGIND